jgi:hypothetical protein
VSATPEQIAERLEKHPLYFWSGSSEPEYQRSDLPTEAAALIRAQAERVRVLEEALNVIAQWDISDRPLIANEDNIRADDFPFYVAGRAHAELALISNYARNSVARAALKAAP